MLALGSLALSIGFGGVTAARAEPLELFCSSATAPQFFGDMHVTVDLEHSAVWLANEQLGRFGPFAASISDAYIRWVVHSNISSATGEMRYVIDRIGGTIVAKSFDGDHEDGGSYEGQCRRATQKF